MRLDNSAFTLYMLCPKMYYERYEADVREVRDRPQVRSENASSSAGVAEEPTEVPVVLRGIELASRSRDGLDFGTRFHQLADHARLRKMGQDAVGRELDNRDGLSEQLHAECDATFAAYEAHYLGSEYTYLESERTHVIPLPNSPHELVVKIDGVVRFGDGTIGPLDTKTESKPGYNFREDWAGRTQASLYLWALTQLYPKERVSRLVVDVVTRGTARRGPTFYRLDDISRPQESLDEAIRNVIWVCEDIEESRRTGFWRSNMNICKQGWKRCDYYDLHVYGRTLENLAKFKPAEAYLDV
jgi:hypothetical protein